MKSSPRTFVSKAAAAATAGLGALALLALPSTPAHAAVDAGIITIINPATAAALPSGGSATTWSLKLPTPPADACSGDSATKAYFVYSYITPVANDPLSLVFGSNGPAQPAGSFAAPLIDIAGSPYIAKTTAPNTGQVKDFPGVQFNFNRFTIDGRLINSRPTIKLPAGLYNYGIACANGNTKATDKVWNGLISFTASAADPNGEVWAAVPFTAPGAPRNLTANPGALDANGLFSVNLAWQAPGTDGGKAVTTYEIYRGTAPGTGAKIASIPATRKTYADKDHVVDVTTRFYYTVKAVNQIGASAASNEASAKASPWNLVP